MSDGNPIRISDADLKSESVEEYVATQSWLTQDGEQASDQPWLIRVIYANWFYLSICSGIGGVIAWAAFEPFYDDNAIQGEDMVAAILMFPSVAAGIGLFLGAAEGIMCRNAQRAVISGAVGLGVGFFGGLVALIPTGVVFVFFNVLAAAFAEDLQPDEMPTGMALLIFMMGRAAAWAIISIPAGIGQGIALREKKVILNGLVGGLLGGLIGGLLFDPISMVLVTDDGQAVYSRGVGFAVIGLAVGLFVGLVEGWTKTAWLLMKEGPLAGKQFVMYRDTTVLGSSPKAEVYLFKDDAIEPQHAVIYNRGGRFEIEDQETPDGTYVNGIPIKTHLLQNGDVIVLGRTVLEFSLRESA